MSVRLPLIAATALVLVGCKPAVQVDCCCKTCPTSAAPAAPTSRAATGEPAGAVRPAAQREARAIVRAVHRARPARRERAYVAEGVGGTYASGRRYAGVSVSVEETETYSSRYSESSSAYAYGTSSASGYVSGYAARGAAGYGEAYAQGGRDHPPAHRGYPLAGTDRDGYLTWPTKVDN